jgi:mono/diheme cytochrome c family protein
VVGENLFGRYCGSCHGERGTGDVLGPSFLDTLYLPPRLTQQAVIDAVLNGVRQKHWRFGDMPPLRRVSGNELLAIFGYIQWVQLRGLARQAHGTVGKVAP